MPMERMMDGNKRAKYEDLMAAVQAVLEDETDPVVWMATVTSLIRGFLRFYWIGFYRVLATGELAIGPYQGSLACLRIPEGKGACGLAAAQGRSIVIFNVDEFPAHISCDSNSRSEIVVPVLDRAGRVRALLDIDSDEIGAFDDIDRECLEQTAGLMQGIAWD